ncbi:hypothetical protein [Stutzerimonas frequens]|uniref:hypothetical protein n=1 Tax=Stutzerimonas frequens TaxID=2968969 RepID=UPI001E54D0BC|nr:hypothetical protein [Stutzerimonas frequens]MCQ4304465.1 hypothetical protein [Stutzerimonas frequens]
MGVSESFQHYVLDPILLQFSSLFDLNGRLGLLFLGVSYAVAYLLFRYLTLYSLIVLPFVDAVRKFLLARAPTGAAQRGRS